MNEPSTPGGLVDLSKRLGYEFKDPGLLELACIHKSFGNEQRADHAVATRDNERLEFLGDAILDLAVSQILLEEFPEHAEGDLSKLRAGLVNEKSLAQVARELDLGFALSLGKGEDNTGGRDKDSILASAFEAIVAAVFLDGGFNAAEALMRRHFTARVRGLPGFAGLQDYKTRLQEVLQARYKCSPQYEVVQATGPDHDKTFEIRLLVNGKVVATASGKSKKEAEQNAAQAVFERYGPAVDL